MIYKFQIVDSPKSRRLRVYPSAFDAEMPNVYYEVTTGGRFKRHFVELGNGAAILQRIPEMQSRWSIPQEEGAIFDALLEDGRFVRCTVAPGPRVAEFHRVLGWFPRPEAGAVPVLQPA